MLQEQSQEIASELLNETESVERTISIMEMIMNGGAAGIIIIGILFVLLIIAVYIYLALIFAIRAASKIDRNFMNQIKEQVASGNIQGAKILCVQNNTPVARLTEKGISRIGNPLEDISSAIENAGKLEVYKLEKNVGLLSTISGAAPMIGFLGTVIGMVLAFHQLATSSGQAEMGQLAEGIYLAMTTTVAGLIVGIVAYMGYNHLVIRTDKLVHLMEANALEFMDMLNEPS